MLQFAFWVFTLLALLRLWCLCGDMLACNMQLCRIGGPPQVCEFTSQQALSDLDIHSPEFRSSVLIYERNLQQRLQLIKFVKRPGSSDHHHSSCLPHRLFISFSSPYNILLISHSSHPHFKLKIKTWYLKTSSLNQIFYFYFISRLNIFIL